MSAFFESEFKSMSHNPMFPAFAYLVILGIALIILF